MLMQRPAKVFSRFLMLVSLMVTRLEAQQLNFRTYSYQEGLSSVNIFNTVQDLHGFIWVATQDGLYRFNGTGFQQFKSNTADGISTPGNAFMFVAADGGGYVYAADYQQGLDKIHTATLQLTTLGAKTAGFTALPNFWIWGIVFDQHGNLWLRGADYLAVKPKTADQFTIITQLPGFSGAVSPSFIRPFGKDHVAAGIPGYGTLIFESSTLRQVQTIRRFFPGDKGNGAEANDVVMHNDTIFVAAANRIIAGKWKNNQWQFIREYESPALQDAVVSSMVFDRNGVLWIGTNNGLVRASSGLHIFTRYQTRPGDNRWLADNKIQHLMIDREDNLWISTSNVLQVVSTRSKGFTAYNGIGQLMDHVYTLASVDDSIVLATGTNGLFAVNTLSGASRKISGTENLGLIHHVEKVQNGEWLLSSEKGMHLFRPGTGMVSQEALLRYFPEWAPFVKNYFNTSFRHGNSWYWASEENEGLLKWTPDEHRMEQFKAGTARSHGLPENHLRNLKADKEGYLWLLSDFTATQFDMNRDTVVSVIRRSAATFNANLLFDFYDDGNTYWFASYGGGINGMNKKNGSWIYFTEKEGLSNNCVYGLLPENDSVIWATTNMGLSRVNTRIMRCSNYYYEDGLQDNTFEEKGTLLDSHYLYFGGIRGFTRLDPSQIDPGASSFPVFIYRVEYYQGEQRHIQHDLTWDKIELPPGTSTIRIYLAALSFSGNNKHRFSYSIPGIQDEFIDVDKDNIISLAGLQGGQYNIRIRYRNKDGSYASRQLELGLVIRPHWYQTTVFKTALILFVVGLAYVFYRMRIAQFKKEKQIRSQLASDLHDDLGSTLNSIKVYCNLALLEKENNDYLVQIKQGTQESIAGLKDIIWVLDDKRDSLDDMLARVEQFAIPLCQASGIRFLLQADKEIRTQHLGKNEKRNLYLIIKESINNSLKYAGCTTIRVTAEKENKGLKLRIEDDGTGFDSGQVTSGYGLKNINNRALDIGYNCAITSEPGSGTRIHLQKN